MSSRQRIVRPECRSPVPARIWQALVGGRPRSPRALWLLLPVVAGAALLVYFHALLFWQRLTDLTLFQPQVALRWLGSLALLAAWYALQRRGVPLLWGRRAAVLWLLVLLLHVSFPVPAYLDPVALFEPDAAAQGWLVLPVAVGLTLLGVFLLRALRRATRRSAGPPSRRREHPGLRAARPASGFPFSRFARPPPLVPQP